jgi:hypothetical protein
MMATTDLTAVKSKRDRITLPKEIVENAASTGLAQTGTTSCWLVVVSPGRYRLAGAEAVSKILRQIEEVAAPGDVLDDTESNPQDAIRARLIPCTVSAPPPAWRLNFPKAARQLVPETEEHSYMFVMIVAGFIELWFPDTLRRAVSAPISKSLS